MPTGTVKFFNADKGYGFIAPFEVEIGRNGKASAVNLSAAD